MFEREIRFSAVDVYDDYSLGIQDIFAVSLVFRITVHIYHLTSYFK